MTSTGFAPLAWVKAFLKAEEFLKCEPMDWKCASAVSEDIQKAQQTLISCIALMRNDLPKGEKLVQLEAFADRDVKAINQALKNHNFDIQLTDQKRPDVFYLAAIEIAKIAWLCAGEKGKKLLGKRSFYLDGDKNGIQFYDIGFRYDKPLVQIHGQHGVSMFILEHTSCTPQVLLQEVMHYDTMVKNGTATKLWRSLPVNMPNILLKGMQPDVSWVQEMWAPYNNSRCTILEAKHQTTFAVGPKGAAGRSAAAASMMLESTGPKIHNVDYDKIMWLSYDGLPLFGPCYYVSVNDHVDYDVDINKI